MKIKYLDLFSGIGGFRYSLMQVCKKFKINCTSIGLCEIDDKHKTFLTPVGKQYMQKHHLIPMEFYEEFEYTLDDINNIVSLCPLCHSKIHQGREEDVEPMIKQLWEKRRKGLKQSKIEIEFERLKKMYFK